MTAENVLPVQEPRRWWLWVSSCAAWPGGSWFGESVSINWCQGLTSHVWDILGGGSCGLGLVQWVNAWSCSLRPLCNRSTEQVGATGRFASKGPSWNTAPSIDSSFCFYQVLQCIKSYSPVPLFFFFNVLPACENLIFNLKRGRHF